MIEYTPHSGEILKLPSDISRIQHDALDERITGVKQVGDKIVYEVRKEVLGPAFGLAFFDIPVALVRNDISEKVKKFVEAHELYHLDDPHKWGGWIGREVRANIIPGIQDPIGFFHTLFASIGSKERLKLYADRFKKGY